MQREERIEYLDPSEIEPDPNQPRQTWTDKDREEIESMVESLKAHGVIEPVEVDENNSIILGERRWKACKIAKVKVPVRRKAGLKQQQRFERQIIADHQRKELSPMDKAWAFATAIANINSPDGNYTVKQIKAMDKKLLLTLVATPTVWKDGKRQAGGQAELSDRTGIPQPTISVYLRTLELPEQVQEAIDTGKVPITTFRTVDRLKDENLRGELQKAIVRDVQKSDKKIVRTELDQLVDFVNKPEVQNPLTKQTIPVELTEEEKKALVQRKIKPQDIEAREISKSLQSPPEVQEKAREAIKETQKQVEKLKQIPEVKERSAWYQNWLAHGSIEQALQGASCPICGSKESLGWLCHNLKFVDAFRKVTEEYQKRVK